MRHYENRTMLKAAISTVLRKYYPGIGNHELRKRLRHLCLKDTYFGHYPNPGYGLLRVSTDTDTENIYSDLRKVCQANGFVGK